MMSSRQSLNFVVHRLCKTLTPTGVTVIDDSCRLEDSNSFLSTWCGLQTCSIITRLRWKNNTIRIKQFLYDLGPSSTLGLGAFFDFYPRQIELLYLTEKRVAWFGYDNKCRPALGFLSNMTNIQISAEDGEICKEDFLSIANSLVPTSDSVAKKQKSFSERSYWSRHPKAYYHLTKSSDYAIPTSFWRLRWPIDREIGKVVWDCADSYTFGDWLIDSKYRRYSNGIAVEKGELLLPSKSRQHQLIFRRKLMAGAPSPTMRAPGELPDIDSHSGFSEFTVNIFRTVSMTYFIASYSIEHGPHDAISWNSKGECSIIQASTLQNFSLTAFMDMLPALYE